MWIGNPSQPKTYRSPWFTEQKYPHGEGINNVQNKTNNRRLDQFGTVLSEEQKQGSIPGPIIRTQTFPGTPSPQNAKHESSSIFYNYEDITLLNRGYKVAPYWRFGQWAYTYPEYLKLTCPVENVGYVKVGEGPSGPVLIPVGVSTFNTGTFLLKQSSGFQWTNPDVSYSYKYATDQNQAWSVTYVPCYSITSKTFPSRFCSWSFSFRPFHYMDGSENSQGATISPYTWHLSCLDLKQLRTTNYIYIVPPPTSGGLRFTYGTLTTSLATWVDTGNLTNDAETYRALLQTRFNGITTVPNGSEVFTAYIDSNIIVYKVHIESTSYQVLQVHTNTLNSEVTIEEDVSAAYLATSGNFFYFVPQVGFSKPNGTCKDTREIGIFDRDYMTTLVSGVGSEFFTFGETKSAQGLSHGSVNLNKRTAFRSHTIIPASRNRINSNPSFFDYPGWHLFGLSRDFEVEQQLRYDLYERNNQFSLTVEPIYL